MSSAIHAETPGAVPLRPVDAGSSAMLHYAGIARLGVLTFVTVGAAVVRGHLGVNWLLGLYLFWFATSVYYLYRSRRVPAVRSTYTWFQVAIDFFVVAVTVAQTHGPTSFFTFIFVVVVLEAGLFLGMMQGFIVATLASVAMAAILLYDRLGPGAEAALAVTRVRVSTFELIYSFLVECLAFYLTAFLSGYWHHRLNWMERFQRKVLDNLNNGFVIADTAGTVLVINRAAKEILGATEPEVLGRPIARVLRMEMGGECPVMTALRLDRDYTSYEFRAVLPGRASRLLGLTTNRIKERNGKTTGIIASFSDLTLMDQMRQEVRRQDRLAVVGELAAGLAHEIRNPVAVIRGAVDEMRDHPATDETLARLIRIALRESDHLNDIVTGFLDFAREPTMKRETFDLRDVITEVGHLLRLDHDGAAIEVALPEDACFVSGDATQLRQVFVNLGMNAIEAMEGTGTLRIVVTRDGGPWIVRFEDEGPGVPPDQSARIFEPFYTTKATGVGMGLAVCMRIVTAHDGTLRASSRQGGGCAMVVSLPAAPVMEAVLT